MLEYGHRLDLFEYPDQHGFSGPRRLAAMRFLRRWLLERDDNPPEQEMVLQTAADLQCTESGQVLSELQGVSLQALNSKRAEAFAGVRAELWERSTSEALEKVKQPAGIRLPVPTPQVISYSYVPTEDEVPLGYGTDRSTGIAHSTAQTGALFTIEKIVLQREDEVPLPGLLMVPMSGPAQRRPAVIHVAGEGKPRPLSHGKDIARYADLTQHVTDGKVVLALDLRGFEETAAEADAWTQVYYGTDYETAFLAFNIGRPLLGQRAEDILAAVNYLAGQADVDMTEIELMASGAAGPAALHAAVFDERIAKLTITGAITSWIDVVHHPLLANQLTGVVPSALEYYDLRHLVETVAPRTVTIRDPVDVGERTQD